MCWIPGVRPLSNGFEDIRSSARSCRGSRATTSLSTNSNDPRMVIGPVVLGTARQLSSRAPRVISSSTPSTTCLAVRTCPKVLTMNPVPIGTDSPRRSSTRIWTTAGRTKSTASGRCILSSCSNAEQGQWMPGTSGPPFPDPRESISLMWLSWFALTSDCHRGEAGTLVCHHIPDRPPRASRWPSPQGRNSKLGPSTWTAFPMISVTGPWPSWLGRASTCTPGRSRYSVT